MVDITFRLEVCAVGLSATQFQRTVAMNHIPRVGEYVDFDVDDAVDGCVCTVTYHLDGRVTVWLDVVKLDDGDTEYRDEICRRLLGSGFGSGWT